MFADSGSAILTFSGSGSSSIVLADSGAAVLQFSGSGSSAVAFASNGSALLTFAGSGASVVAFADDGTASVAVDFSGDGASVIVFDDLGLGPRAFVLDGGGPPPPKDHVPGKPRKYAQPSEPFVPAPDFEPLQGFVFGHGQSAFMILTDGQGLIAWGDGQDDDEVMTLLALLGEL